MKWVLPLVIAALIMSCSRGPVQVTGLNLPELDSSEYYDSAYQSGWALLRQGRPKAAMEQFEQSQLKDEKLHVAFGYVFLMQKKYRLAQKNFRQALRLSPGSLRARVGIANVHEVTGDEDAAFRMYAELRAEFPDNPWIKLRYDYLKSTQTDWYLRQAEEYGNRGDEDGYLRALTKAAQYSPELLEIQLRIADTYFAKEDYKKAAGYYENLSQRLIDNEAVLEKLGQAYEAAQEYDAAIVTYKRLLQQKPGDMELINKINDLKIQFYDVDLPVKFKNIFFKYNINREDLAALIGHYFAPFFPEEVKPVIITDIAGSYAREQIIKLCTLGIMDVRPDHGFDRHQDVTRAGLAKTLFILKKFLEQSGISLTFNPTDEMVSPIDISAQHRDYGIIRFMVNTGLMNLDREGQFNPTEKVAPSDALMSIRKLLVAIDNR